MARRKGQRSRNRPAEAATAADSGWIWGTHSVHAALANARRRALRLVATAEAAAHLPDGAPQPETASAGEISALLPPGAVHQGLALQAGALPETRLEEVCAAAEGLARAAVVVLDRADDPRNVGAVLRAAAAFGAMAVIVPDRHAPPASGVMAKAASGALEAVPLVRVANIARALEILKRAGFWCVGFDASAEARLDGDPLPARAALVLGAEGAGLRRLTREQCDLLVRVPMTGAVESLNLSTAAAVALYEFARGN